MSDDRRAVAAASTPIAWLTEWWEYWADAAQRTFLFWDVLRQRGNTYLKHQESGKPPVLAFDYETILDGRKLDRPCNYALLRIKPKTGQMIDPKKRPYVVIDPRAGHGPGIGGFKADSQVGVALRAGHPVYFVSFFPEPVPGQRLRDVAAAEALFIEEVARRHPKAQGKPCVIGNCQAGWAVAALAATRPGIMGPVILNGAPLSYWSGSGTQNPMRYSGGLMGGKWVQSMTCDLGGGLFDGAHLVANFENLDPANTLWKKYYNLYSKVDTEGARFLGFEQWWGGYFLMNREEIDAIVSELFVGNKLARRQIVNEEGIALDLRNIKSPIVIFASYGDNITPPQQALNWIEDVYGDEKGIIDSNQTIVYLLHDDIGHLGIFVSGRVAAKEHTELVGTLEMIDALPPGLYEMIIEGKRPDDPNGEWEPGSFTVRVEARTMNDIRSLDDTRKEEGYFQTVDEVSKLNDRLYQTYVSPWMRASTSSMVAEGLRRLHPLRLQHAILSDRNPMLASLGHLADLTRRHRSAIAKDNRFLAAERMASAGIVAALDAYRDLRDTLNEWAFKVMYGPAGFGALFPPQALPAAAPVPAAEARVLPDEAFERGGLLAAVLRIVAGAVLNRGVFDRRSALIFASIREHSRFKDASPAEVKELFKTQSQLFRQDPDRALSTLAVLLPRREERLLALEAVRRILMIAPHEIHVRGPMAERLFEILQVDFGEQPIPDEVRRAIELANAHVTGAETGPAHEGDAMTAEERSDRQE